VNPDAENPLVFLTPRASPWPGSSCCVLLGGPGPRLAILQRMRESRDPRAQSLARAKVERDWRPLARLAPRTVDLPDGTVGWYVRLPRSDDCWAAAVATCLQVPIEDVPDPEVDARLRAGEDPGEIDRSAWEEFSKWLAERELRMVAHKSVPVARRRWVGIVPHAGAFNDHTLVMSGSELLFDPMPELGSIRILRAEASAVQ